MKLAETLIVSVIVAVLIVMLLSVLGKIKSDKIDTVSEETSLYNTKIEEVMTLYE